MNRVTWGAESLEKGIITLFPRNSSVKGQGEGYPKTGVEILTPFTKNRNKDKIFVVVLESDNNINNCGHRNIFYLLNDSRNLGGKGSQLIYLLFDISVKKGIFF